MRRVAIVLCGGKSSRMGRAKAWLPWSGRTMIEHVVHSLRPAVDEVVVVSSGELALPPLDARIVEDREPALGPLAGIREGLEAAGADLAFVTSTDAPFLTAGYVEEMLRPGVARAPRAEGHVQVLSAVYPGAAWKDAAELLSQGQRRPLALLERIGFEAVDVEVDEAVNGDAGRASDLPPGPAPWQGFNTPSEYLYWARWLDPDATAEVELLGRAALGLEERRFRVPIGTLREILGKLALPIGSRLVDGDQLARTHLVSLGGRDLVRNLELPIGAGEHVCVIDALAGG